VASMPRRPIAAPGGRRDLSRDTVPPDSARANATPPVDWDHWEILAQKKRGACSYFGNSYMFSQRTLFNLPGSIFGACMPDTLGLQYRKEPCVQCRNASRNGAAEIAGKGGNDRSHPGPSRVSRGYSSFVPGGTCFRYFPQPTVNTVGYSRPSLTGLQQTVFATFEACWR
jgi:hypothetical protein